VTRLDNGGFEVEQGDVSAAQAADARARHKAEHAEESAPEKHFERTDRRAAEPAAEPPAAEPIVQEFSVGEFVSDDTPGRRLGPRGGTTRRRGDGPPPLFEGQGLGSPAVAAPAARTDQPDQDLEDDFDVGHSADVEQPDAPDTAPAAEPLVAIDAEALGLPTDRDAQIIYLTTSYKGIGEKTAEQVADAFGERLFEVLNSEQDRVRDLLSPARADQLLAAWEEDIERRVVRLATDH